LPLQRGLELAQIDWDGATALVDWVTVDKVIASQAVPRIELAGFVKPGASGGGVFWNGNHIANTSSQVTVCANSNGAVLNQHSVAALNSPQLTTPTKGISLALQPVDNFLIGLDKSNLICYNR
jgi:hypothetical protein